MALPKTFTAGERLFAEDLNEALEYLDGETVAVDARLTTAETDIDNLQSATSGAAYVPTGSVFWFAANAAPTGYLKCNGALVSRSTYAALFAVVGTTFGSGDGSTTFKLPDLRGEFIRGWDDARGVDSGRAFGSAQADAFKSHTHPTPSSSAGSTSGEFYGAGPAAAGTTGATGGAETRPRNVALLACIKT